MLLVCTHAHVIKVRLRLPMAALHIACIAHKHFCVCLQACALKIFAHAFCSFAHPAFGAVCRYFRTDWLTVMKRITPWSQYCDRWGVEFQTLQRVYERTARSCGVVHLARWGEALKLEADKYTVELEPVGLQREDARPSTETEAASAAHGFLHGLDAIHKVRS